MRRLTLLGLMISFLSLTAQEKEYVNAFKNKQLINAQTTVIPEGFDFTIMHRFGKIGLDDRIYKDFLGFDSPANIRFSLSYKLNDRSYVAVGRTKIGKTISVFEKNILTQIEDIVIKEGDNHFTRVKHYDKCFLIFRKIKITKCIKILLSY